MRFFFYVSIVYVFLSNFFYFEIWWFQLEVDQFVDKGVRFGQGYYNLFIY